MFIQYKNLTIRNATCEDSKILVTWWNDGKVMEHAGFPNGLGTNEQKVKEEVVSGADAVRRRLIIEIDGVPAGEMCYMNLGNEIAEIGIKICDFSKQNHGDGKIVLSMLIQNLFTKMGYKKIVLDTNLNNKRAQHVYEKLGFNKLCVNVDSWKDQLGQMQSSVDYELLPENFVSFMKYKTNY